MATQDNLRCARCCMVIFEVFSDIMQELLARRGFSAQKIYDIVTNDLNFFNKLRQQEKDTLQTLRSDGFSKLDASIIYKIVIYYKKIGFIPIPTTKWGVPPLPNDTDIGDDVERIRSARNEFAHKTNADTSEHDFEKFFNQFLDVGQRVDTFLNKNPGLGYKRRIQDLKNTKLDTETAETILEQRQEIEQLKQELVIKENKKEVAIFIGISVEEMIQKISEGRDPEDISSPPLKLTVEGVVDSEEQLNMLKQLVGEIDPESTIRVRSVEKLCIELIVDINSYFLKSKKLLLEAITIFLTLLTKKQAFKWKGNKVTIVITIDEEFEEHSSSKSSLVLNLEMKAQDLRDGQLNQQLASFVENLLRKSNGRELFEEKHVNASLVVEDTWNFAEEADNGAFLELTDQQLNIENPQHVTVSLAQTEARIDQDINKERTSKMTDKTEQVMEEKDGRELFEETDVNASLVVEDTRNLALADEADNDELLQLADQQLNIGNPQHAKDSIDETEARLDQDINQIRTSKMTDETEQVLKDRDGRELVEETHANASLVVEDTRNLADKADYVALLELANHHLKIGNPQHAKDSIAEVEARLDQEFNKIKTSKRTDQTEHVLEDKSKAIGKQYRMCSLLLLKMPGSVSDAVRCFYTGLICYGSPDLYDYAETSSIIWKKIQVEAIQREKLAHQVMEDLVHICYDLYESHTRIILFMAFELATKCFLLMSELPEHSKMNIYTLVYRCWLICARCHYILKEYNKAVEVLSLFCKDPRHSTNTDVLELWAFCLLQTENYTLAKQKVEQAIKVAISEEQKTRFKKLESHLKRKIQEKNYTQNEENYDSENASTKDSGYSYCSHIDLVESANIDFETEVDDVGNEWSDKQSIADSQYSALSDACSSDDTTSSVSTRSRKKKIRRKTKTVRRKKQISSGQILSGQHPIHYLPVSKSFDKVEKWRIDHQPMTGNQHQKVNHDESRTDFMEIRYPEGDRQSENMSDVSSIASCTTMSLAGLSADEFSGSEYDVSDSDCDWYNSASDFEEEADDLEETSLEEPTYFQRSLSLHSGQMKARNILEKEYFQKGLNLNDEWIESVGSRYFKRKKNIYNEIRNKNFSDQCKKIPRIYKKCTISIESAHKAVCKPLEPKDEIQEISIAGRSKCGQTFTDDTVVVKIYAKQYLGKVHGEVVSLVKRHRYEDMEHPVFVCLLDIKEGHLMKPLCRTVPKLHVLHSRVKDRFRKSRVEIYNYDADKRELNFLHFHDVQEGEREQWLFIVALIKWKPNKIYPLAAVIDVIHCSQNPYDGIRILSKEYQVPYFYEKSTIEGIKAAFKEAKVFNASGYVDNTFNQRIFTIDSPGSKNIENAFSIKMQENGEFVVAIHITDVTTIVKKNDPVDMEAKARCVTFYPGKGFRPFAMLPEPLSESLCSLLPDQKRPVISVYFKFDKKGNLAEPKPTIQKSVIKSSKQFTYQEVQNILDDKLEEQHIELSQDIKMLFKFSKHLKEVRLGHASFSFPVEIDVSEDENPMDTYEAHSLVEEFVILTNHGIATLLRRQYPGSVPLYCQEPPSNEVFDNWYNMNQHYIHHVLGLQTIGTPRGKISVFHSPPEGRTRRLTPVQTWVLDEIKDLLPETAQNMSRIKQLIKSDFLHPKQALAYHEWNLFQESSKYVCSTEILANQGKGRYFFLGKRSYVHFTSPLSRYNDLVVHRLVSAMIKKETYPPYAPQEISDLCLIMNDATKRANQFNNDCKQLIFGRFFKRNPVLFNGFVKETSDNGIKIVIPGLQNLPTFRKEIQFKLLDVACKPEKGDDVEMLSMTKHEKERKMVVVKWEKRLYSYKHRTCRKPKTSRISYERNLFSPYLRIFPHQNTTFLRYKEHWIRILTCILEEKIDSLRNLLSNFKDDEQTILNVLHDKDTVSSFKRSVTDVSSEVKQGIIVEHRCRFQVPYHHGQIIQLQMSASLNRGFLTPTPQVLDVTENVKFCIDHFDNPIKTLLRFATLHTKSKYADIDDYIRTWIPIVEMESTLNAVQNEDTAVINDIPVEFMGRRGRFVLTKGFCDVRDMDVSSGDIEKLSAGIIDGTEKTRNEASRYQEHRHNTDEEVPMSSADETDPKDKISNSDETENSFLDTNLKEIETTTRSEMDLIELNLEKRESEEKSKDGSSQKKKPKYSKILSPHFLCIKLKCPLTENVKAKIGKTIPKQSQFIWVAHAELLKSRKIRGKTYSERRGCFKKVLEIDLVFKLHKNSSLPPINKVTPDDKCSIELILKSKVFRRIECYIKLLGQASELAKNIALGHRISGLDQDHLRLCRTMGYEVDIPDFPANNIQQDTAIKKALNSRFSLIQGPPGTGKTFTGVKLVYLFNRLNKLFEEKDGKRRRVIFCGPSNKSVDLVARWVVKKLGAKAPKIVRMYASAYEYLDYPVPGRAIISGRSMRDAKSDVALNTNGVVLHHIIRSDGKPHAAKIQEFDAKFRADNIIIKENEKLPHEQRKPVKTRLQDIYEYKSLLHTATVEELDNYDVIFCTTSLAGNPRLLTATKDQVAQVIIDECGMCSEPECMVPIIATHANQVVLIGDHKQLRPIIKSREASELGLEKSLFERYSTDDSLMTMLEQQYRMNKSICEFPSRMFYDGKLKTAHEKIGKPIKPLKMWQKSNGIPRVFCHVEGEEETLTVKTKEGNEQSRSNKREIEQVLKVFRHMVTVEGVDPGTINIMSQYNAQCTALRVELTEKGFDKFDVTTVVSSQGGEWDYVIFSLVRSLPKYMIEKNPTEGWCIQNLGFITDRHQINVALTRAKKGLVIIGNKNLLVGNEVWKKLLEDYEMNDCIFESRQFP